MLATAIAAMRCTQFKFAGVNYQWAVFAAGNLWNFFANINIKLLT